MAEARQGQHFANVSDDGGRLLRQLTEAINPQGQHVVELGTSCLLMDRAGMGLTLKKR